MECKLFPSIKNDIRSPKSLDQWKLEVSSILVEVVSLVHADAKLSIVNLNWLLDDLFVFEIICEYYQKDSRAMLDSIYHIYLENLKMMMEYTWPNDETFAEWDENYGSH